MSAANSHLHPAQGTLATLAHAAATGGCAAVDTWADPAVNTHTNCVSRPHTPQQPEASLHSPREAGTAAGAEAATGTASLADQPLLSSPLSLLAALSLDQYVQSPLGSPDGSRHASRPTTPAAAGTPGGSGSGGRAPALNAAAVAREATQQLISSGALLSSPKSSSSRAAGALSKLSTHTVADWLSAGCVMC